MILKGSPSYPLALMFLCVVLLFPTVSSGDLYMFNVKGPLPVDDKSILILEGTLQTGEFFGPPDYGNDPKNDSVERVYILQVPLPVAFRYEKPSNGLAKEGEVYWSCWIQLIPHLDSGMIDQHIGRRIRTKGKAFWAHTGHHRTAVLLSLDHFEPINAYARWNE